MTESQILVLAGGAVLLGVLGAFHMSGLRLIGWCTPRRQDHPHLSVIATFWSLGLLHLAEIALGALMLWLLLLIPGTGSLGTAAEPTPADYLYVAGSSFVTLGYAQVNAHGAIRLLIMLLSLGGFMVLTWSATFIYSMWGEIFREES
ncbi:hypothetical protein [Pelagerythrobacter aerophilus]